MKRALVIYADVNPSDPLVCGGACRYLSVWNPAISVAEEDVHATCTQWSRNLRSELVPGRPAEYAFDHYRCRECVNADANHSRELEVVRG